MQYSPFIRRLPLFLALTLLTQCSKCKQDPTPAKPEDQLPPATQTGARTLGFLLNGQPWTPSGNNGQPNLLVSYDPNYQGGDLVVSTYRFSDKKRQYMNFGIDKVINTGTYNFNTIIISPSTPHNVNFFDNLNTNCSDYTTNIGTTNKGQITITRLDNQQGIISGTFDFTLSQPGCDTLKFTHGRFDWKF